jgi:hypothetical protein
MEEREDAREPRQDKKDGQYGGLRCRERKRRKRPRNSRQLSQAIDYSYSYYHPSSSSHIHRIRNCMAHAMFENTIAFILALTAPIHGSCPELPACHCQLARCIIIVFTTQPVAIATSLNAPGRPYSTGCCRAIWDRPGQLLYSCPIPD